jgi:hypothetical protein
VKRIVEASRTTRCVYSWRVRLAMCLSSEVGPGGRGGGDDGWYSDPLKGEGKTPSLWWGSDVRDQKRI